MREKEKKASDTSCSELECFHSNRKVGMSVVGTTSKANFYTIDNRTHLPMQS